MLVLKRKILSRIGTIAGIISFLMLFVMPFIIVKIPGTDNKLCGVIYFIIFLICTAVANISFEKSAKPVSLDEEREEKIRQIFK